MKHGAHDKVRVNTTIGSRDDRSSKGCDKEGELETHDDYIGRKLFGMERNKEC